MLLHEFISEAAARTPDGPALIYQRTQTSYGELARHIASTASGYVRLGLGHQERVAVFLEKRTETVVALFAAAAAGAVFVPINPLLKPDQVAYILRDCNVRILVTSRDRYALLAESLRDCHDLHTVVVVDGGATSTDSHWHAVDWTALHSEHPAILHRVIDTDMVGILYTSGSTGKPKGVVLSHQNMVAGAQSVASYLGNRQDDRLLAVLPLSFDYGLSQITTAFWSGACAVLMNYLLPRDVLRTAERDEITGLAAVPPLWVQLAQLEWPTAVKGRLRYITNSGGKMPGSVVTALRNKLTSTKVFLMYGLTEAFRSTYLPPSELDRRPDSIGKAIPNAEVMVVREDGSPCAPGEPGELVHRGALVSLGYWNDPAKTAERFRPEPNQPAGIPVVRLAVWSGDTVQMDDEGYLYFVARKDDMIKTQGYRVSPTEVEEVLYATGLLTEAVAIGVPHPTQGQAIVAVVVPRSAADFDAELVLSQCRQRLPAFMVPALVKSYASLPRNPNGKIDRKHLAGELDQTFPTSH